MYKILVVLATFSAIICSANPHFFSVLNTRSNRRYHYSKPLVTKWSPIVSGPYYRKKPPRPLYYSDFPDTDKNEIKTYNIITTTPTPTTPAPPTPSTAVTPVTETPNPTPSIQDDNIDIRYEFKIVKK